MKFRQQLRYDAPPADVYAMLADPAFREMVARAQKATTVQVSIHPQGPGMAVVVDQTRPSDGVPGFARKIVGDQIRILQRETWKGPSGAGLSVTIPGKPGELNGSVLVEAGGSGTVETVQGDLKVSVPLLAGKLESLVAGLLTEALEVEQKVGLAWLRGGSEQRR